MVKKYDKFLIEFANYISISFIPEVSCSRRKLLSIWKVTSARLIMYLFYFRQNKNRSYFQVICSYVTARYSRHFVPQRSLQFLGTQLAKTLADEACQLKLCYKHE